jgi:K+-transporting ATPase ATPase C chain
MRSQLRPAIVVFVSLTVLTGVAYPLLVTGIAQTFFPEQANGSLIIVDGRREGSSLIGQPFADPKYFWSRPSATSPAYNAGASSGSNLGPTNPALLDAIRDRVKKLREADLQAGPYVPVDLVTASASGLDPHISPAAAEYQVSRVAKTRNLDVSALHELVAKHIEGRTLGILGEPRVNVLLLNRALDALEKK